ncbi:hypothetical protein OAH34_01285 [bacterium]|nr:hypothetical protein [bacterium]
MKATLWKAPKTERFSSFAISGEMTHTTVTSNDGQESRETFLATDALTGAERWPVAMSSSDHGNGGGDAEGTRKSWRRRAAKTQWEVVACYS